jgi:hypothetical protein
VDEDPRQHISFFEHAACLHAAPNKEDGLRGDMPEIFGDSFSII